MSFAHVVSLPLSVDEEIIFAHVLIRQVQPNYQGFCKNDGYIILLKESLCLLQKNLCLEASVFLAHVVSLPLRVGEEIILAHTEHLVKVLIRQVQPNNAFL